MSKTWCLPSGEQLPEMEERGKQSPVDSRERPTLHDKMSDFSQQTTLHGVKYIMGDYVSKPRRFLWAVVVVVQLVGLGVVIVSQLLHVSSRPLLTKIITKYVDELPFPAVTICRELYLWTHEGMSDLENEILENYENQSYFKSLPSDVYAKINMQDIYRKRLELEDDFVYACLFGFLSCLHLVQKRLMSDKLCYTINSVLPEDNPVFDVNSLISYPDQVTSLISKEPGLSSGLQVDLLLTDVEAKGVLMVVHEPDEKIVMMNSEFLQLARGNIHYIGLSVHKNKFLPAPFKAFGDRECVEIPPDFRRGDLRRGRYTVRACQDACRLDAWAKFCGCSTRVGAEKPCDPLKYLDCQTRGVELAKNQTFNLHDVKVCDCPFPCEDVEYHTVLSSKPIESETGKSNLEIAMHFDRLKVVSTEQVADYTGGDVFASVGGQMGLFLGASIVTLIEVLDLLLRCAGAWLFGRLNSARMRNGSKKSGGEVY